MIDEQKYAIFKYHNFAEIIENLGKALVFSGFLFDNASASVLGFYLCYQISSARLDAKQGSTLQRIENQLEKILNKENTTIPRI